MSNIMSNIRISVDGRATAISLTSSKSNARSEYLNSRPSTIPRNWINAPIFVPKSLRFKYPMEEVVDASACEGAADLCPMNAEVQKSWLNIIERSKYKTCGICYDTIVEKPGRENRFGILSNCNHIFCLECIRKWRQSKQFEDMIKRSCPECRVYSDFFCTSAFWVETKEEKDKLLSACKYFKKGQHYGKKR